jgi:hypothetical protein
MSTELREKLQALYDNAMAQYRATGADYWDGASDLAADALAALDGLTDGKSPDTPGLAGWDREEDDMNAEPNPEVVAWMREYLRDSPTAGQFTIHAAWGAAHPHDPAPSGAVMLACPSRSGEGSS